MSLDYLNAFNRRDTQLLAFILLPSNGVGDLITFKSYQMMQAMNYDAPGWREEPGRQTDIEIQHACRLHCELLDINNSVTGRFTVATPALTTLELTTSTTLGIKSGIDPAHSQAILNAFSHYNFAVHGPLSEYIANVATTTGASPLECALFLEHLCKWVSRNYDKSAIDEWLTAYFARKEQRQSYRIVDVEWLSDFPIPSQGPNNLQAPLANAEKTVEQAFDTAVQRTDCAGSVTKISPIKIDQLRLPDEIKVEWEWGYVELDCGGGFHFWKPTTYYRDSTAVLYAVGAYPGNLNGAKQKIAEIILESAKAAAFYALVSGDISTAITVFKELFVQKVIEAFSNLERCLSAEIYVVTETGKWHT